MERDCKKVIGEIWKCEVNKIIRCELKRIYFKNRFKHEMSNYFRTYFPNIVSVEWSAEANDTEQQSDKDIWSYNREYHYWFTKSGSKTVLTDKLLIENNLFNFERLLTKCILKLVIVHYDCKIHG